MKNKMKPSLNPHWWNLQKQISECLLIMPNLENFLDFILNQAKVKSPIL